MSAIDLHARPSADFDAKLAETQAPAAARGRRVRADHAGVQPGRRGRGHHAPDQQPGSWTSRCSCWTPACCTSETLDLLERTQATLARAGRRSTARCNEVGGPVRRPRRQGRDVPAASSCARPAATSARSSRWSARWPAQRAWITGLRREQSNARAEVPLVDASDEAETAASSSIPLANWTWGDVWHYIDAARGRLQPAARRSSIPASAARPAPAPSAWARTSAPAAGGGKTKPPRNAACT